MPNTGEYHRDAVFVGRPDHFFIPHRAARLDGCGGPHFDAFQKTVCKGEKCVGSHYTPAQIKTRVGRFHGRNSGRIYSRHLAGSYSERPVRERVDDGVGLDVLGYTPGEEQRLKFGLCGLTLCDGFHVGGGKAVCVRLLNKIASKNRAYIQTPAAPRGLEFQEPAVLFLLESGKSRIGEIRSNDHLKENGIQQFGCALVDGLIEGNDTAESRLAVRGERLRVRFA